MSILNACPICESPNVRPICAYGFAVSSDSEIIEGRVDNSRCEACGVVFNASGVRGFETQFYERSYGLLTSTLESQFEIQLPSGAQHLYVRYLDWLSEHARLPQTGTILEIGAGKGLFMRAFLDRFPGWRSVVYEPSSKSMPYLRRLIPEAQINNSILDENSALPLAADLVVAIGVLEHVPAPVRTLRQLRRAMAGTGKMFLSVPNFARNPADLFVYDHLTRFEPATLRTTLAFAGFETVAVDSDSGVPFQVLATASDRAPVPLDRGDALDARAAAAWLKDCFALYAALNRNLPPNERFHVYGTGLPFLGAVAENRHLAGRIAAFIDDNRSLRGATRVGRPVIHWDDVQRTDIAHLTFSASPVYLPVMEQKARAYCLPSTVVYPLPDLEVSGRPSF